jgi:poly-gamma-glutamate synthesis protein (capsule biosynthesis protein)
MEILSALVAFITLLLTPFSTSLSAINPPLPAPAAPEKAVILIGGDMMFDRHIRKMMRRYGDDHIFSCIRDELLRADLVVANLEGPVTSNASQSEGSIVGSAENVTFTFAPKVVPMLKRHNIGLVNLANNHIMNFGRDGLMETLSLLDAGGAGYFGNPDVPEAERVARIDIGEMPFSFVSWSDWTGGSADEVRMQIHAERDDERIVIVYAHWGDEYVQPPERVKRLAHSFVDAGAALVVGSHPHIVQEDEMYRGVPIYYSLGNLVFDQYWEDAVRTGRLVEVTFADGAIVSVRERETYLERDGRVCLK